jgi:hypothetical protein
MIVTEPSHLVALLGAYRFHAQDESHLQDAIEKVLRDNGVAFEREVQLSAADHPDFMVGGIVLEVKVDGGPSAVARQLCRYAEHDRVQSIVLVTRRRQHARAMPPALKGKPILVLAVGWI